MKKPSVNKKIVAAVVALVAAIAASYGLVLGDDTQDVIVDVTCSTVLECQE